MLKSDHPVWPVLRLLATACVLGLMLKFNYKDWDSRDVVTVVGVLFSSGVVEILGRKKEAAVDG